jgi:hypothetical protein
MPDVFEEIQQRYKIRARAICADNNGPTLAEKGVRFFVCACPSNADGSKVGPVIAEREISYSVPQLLADPETQALAQQALVALEQIGTLMCQRHAAELRAMLHMQDGEQQ